MSTLTYKQKPYITQTIKTGKNNLSKLISTLDSFLLELPPILRKEAEDNKANQLVLTNAGNAYLARSLTSAESEPFRNKEIEIKPEDTKYVPKDSIVTDPQIIKDIYCVPKLRVTEHTIRYIHRILKTFFLQLDTMIQNKNKKGFELKCLIQNGETWKIDLQNGIYMTLIKFAKFYLRFVVNIIASLNSSTRQFTAAIDLNDFPEDSSNAKIVLSSHTSHVSNFEHIPHPSNRYSPFTYDQLTSIIPRIIAFLSATRCIADTRGAFDGLIILYANQVLVHSANFTNKTEQAKTDWIEKCSESFSSVMGMYTIRPTPRTFVIYATPCEEDIINDGNQIQLQFTKASLPSIDEEI